MFTEYHGESGNLWMKGIEMDFDALISSIKNTEVVNKGSPRQHKQEVYEECNDYYAIPNTKEGFNGDVIKLSGEEFNVFYQKFNFGRDEHKFREKIERIDDWLSAKPYKITQNWLNYLPQWLEKDNK